MQKIDFEQLYYDLLFEHKKVIKENKELKETLYIFKSIKNLKEKTQIAIWINNYLKSKRDFDNK